MSALNNSISLKKKENRPITLAESTQSPKESSSPTGDNGSGRKRRAKRRSGGERVPRPWPTPQQAKKEKQEEVLEL